jgi:hypothetical protein
MQLTHAAKSSRLAVSQRTRPSLFGDFALFFEVEKQWATGDDDVAALLAGTWPKVLPFLLGFFGLNGFLALVYDSVSADSAVYPTVF